MHELVIGVPESAVLLEPRATNTGENIEFTKSVLAKAGVKVSSILLVSKPYEERRSYAMMRKMWPEVEVCASTPMGLEEYADSIGDARMVIDMVVGARNECSSSRGWGWPSSRTYQTPL